MTLFVHVGMQKAGSKALQTFMRSNAARLAQLGFDYPDDLSKGVWHRDLFTDFDPSKAQRLSNHLAAGRHVILSLENAYLTDASLIEQLTRGASDVRLLMFLRAPASWLNSFKNQLVKAHRVTYDECNGFDVTGARIRDIFDIEQHLRRWSAHAPVGEIRLEPYTPSTDVIRAATDWLGIGDPLSAGLKISDHNPNKALSLHGLRVLYEVKRLLRDQPTDLLVSAVGRTHRALESEMVDTRRTPAVWLLTRDEVRLAESLHRPALEKAMAVWGNGIHLDPCENNLRAPDSLEPGEVERRVAMQIAGLGLSGSSPAT